MRRIDASQQALLLYDWIAHPESGRMWNEEYDIYLADEVVRRRMRTMYSLPNPLPDNWLIVHEDGDLENCTSRNLTVYWRVKL